MLDKLEIVKYDDPFMDLNKDLSNIDGFIIYREKNGDGTITEKYGKVISKDNDSIIFEGQEKVSLSNIKEYERLDNLKCNIDFTKYKDKACYITNIHNDSINALITYIDDENSLDDELELTIKLLDENNNVDVITTYYPQCLVKDIKEL